MSLRSLRLLLAARARPARAPAPHHRCPARSPPPALAAAAAARAPPAFPSRRPMATLGRAGSGPAEPSPATVSPADASRLVDLAHLVEGLKREPRRGWLRFGLPRPESVADHSWRLAFLAFVAGSAPGLDCGRCVRLALVHDVAECVVGDITPSCGVPKAEKHAREKAAVARMRDMLGAAAWAAVGADLEALWTEYEECSSPEALLVKDLDKLEMILQARLRRRRDAAVADAPSPAVCHPPPLVSRSLCFSVSLFLSGARVRAAGGRVPGRVLSLHDGQVPQHAGPRAAGGSGASPRGGR